MRLIILGNNGPYPSAGGACSGYLIQTDGRNILIDCGNGVLSNLQKFIKIEDVKNIILTHLHSDHMSDMMVLRYAVQLKQKNGMIKEPIKVFAPGEPVESFQRLNLRDIYELEEIREDTLLNIGNCKISFKQTKHPYKCMAVALETEGKRFVFSGDTAWTEDIVEFCKNSETIMLDSGLLSKDKKDDNVPHMTARECGLVAKKSGAKRLILTHFYPEYRIDDLLNEARLEFEYVDAAEILKTYEI